MRVRRTREEATQAFMECCKEIQKEKKDGQLKELSHYFRKYRIGNLSKNYFKDIEKWNITREFVEDLKMKINIDINFKGLDALPAKKRTARSIVQQQANTELFKDYTEDRMKELCQAFNDIGYSVQIFETSRTVEISRTRNVIIKN